MELSHILIRGLEVKVLIHATENEEKVKKAVRNLLPIDISGKTKLLELDGHFGDSIKLLNINIRNRNQCREVLKFLLNRLTVLNQEQLFEDIWRYIDNSGNLYLRFDKQESYKKKIVISNRDSIRFKFGIQIPHKADPVETIKKYIKEIVSDLSGE
jgi:RNA binding exosome subunit